MQPDFPASSLGLLLLLTLQRVVRGQDFLRDCQANEQFIECGTCEGNCKEPVVVQCRKECKPARCECQAKKGFVRAHDGACIPVSECATYKGAYFGSDGQLVSESGVISAQAPKKVLGQLRPVGGGFGLASGAEAGGGQLRGQQPSQETPPLSPQKPAASAPLAALIPTTRVPSPPSIAPPSFTGRTTPFPDQQLPGGGGIVPPVNSRHRDGGGESNAAVGATNTKQSHMNLQADLEDTQLGAEKNNRLDSDAGGGGGGLPSGDGDSANVNAVELEQNAGGGGGREVASQGKGNVLPKGRHNASLTSQQQHLPTRVPSTVPSSGSTKQFPALPVPAVRLPPPLHPPTLQPINPSYSVGPAENNRQPPVLPPQQQLSQPVQSAVFHQQQSSRVQQSPKVSIKPSHSEVPRATDGGQPVTSAGDQGILAQPPLEAPPEQQQQWQQGEEQQPEQLQQQQQTDEHPRGSAQQLGTLVLPMASGGGDNDDNDPPPPPAGDDTLGQQPQHDEPGGGGRCGAKGCKNRQKGADSQTALSSGANRRAGRRLRTKSQPYLYAYINPPVQELEKASLVVRRRHSASGQRSSPAGQQPLVNGVDEEGEFLSRDDQQSPIPPLPANLRIYRQRRLFQQRRRRR